MNIIILMAGANKDFEQKGHYYPKYLLEVEGKPIAQRIIESIENVGDKIICIIRKEDQDKYFLGDTLKILNPNCRTMEVVNDTKGAVCTALFAIDEINNNEELLILNGDQLITSDIKKAVDDFKKRNLDGGIVTITAVNPKYSSVLLDENNFVIQTSEKRPISQMASTGCSYYKQGCDFVKSAFNVIKKDAKVNDAYYISSTFNEMILEQKKIGIYEIPKGDYISFSSYQMYESYINNRRNN